MGSIRAARSSSIDFRINASSRSRCENEKGRVELLQGVDGDLDFLRAGGGDELGEQFSARFNFGEGEPELGDEKHVEQLVEVSEAGALL